VRARLGRMVRGSEFQFVCSLNMAAKMDRIIAINGGVLRAKEQHGDSAVLTVMKAE